MPEVWSVQRRKKNAEKCAATCADKYAAKVCSEKKLLLRSG